MVFAESGVAFSDVGGGKYDRVGNALEIWMANVEVTSCKASGWSITLCYGSFNILMRPAAMAR